MIPLYEIHPMLVHFPIVLWISAEIIAVVILLRGGDVSRRTQLILIIFLVLTFVNEFLDLPHIVFNDQATTWNQRLGEISIEVVIFIFIVTVEILLSRIVTAAY